MHSGSLATLIEFSTTVAIMAFDKRNRANVSTELSVSLMHSVPSGEEIFILSQIYRIGRTMAFSHATIFNMDFDELAHGKHLKTFLDVRYDFTPGSVSYPKKHTRSSQQPGQDEDLLY